MNSSPPGAEVIVLLSGGLDSSVLLYYVKQFFTRVVSLSVCYGQRHSRELDAARKIALRANVDESCILDLTHFGALVHSALTDKSTVVPQGEYTNETLKSTVVPNRNALLLSAAFGLAFSRNASYVAYAAHAGDHPLYPDCRPEFIRTFERAMQHAWWQPVHLWAPFQDLSKGDIVRRGMLLEVPFELTYSCYVGEEKHCGQCSTCRERKKAFIEADVPDPTEYKKG